MNLTLIASVIAGAVGFGAAWQLQAGNITKIQLEQINERIALQRTNRTNAERHIETVRVAQDKAAVRVAAVVADRKRLDTELDGLRSASEASLRAAIGSLDACLASANAHAVISAQCSERYSALAGDCQGHVIDKQALIESWPK